MPRSPNNSPAARFDVELRSPEAEKKYVLSEAAQRLRTLSEQEKQRRFYAFAENIKRNKEQLGSSFSEIKALEASDKALIKGLNDNLGLFLTKEQIERSHISYLEDREEIIISFDDENSSFTTLIEIDKNFKAQKSKRQRTTRNGPPKTWIRPI